ncbi:hypothetical protein BRC88_13995 [Halobacteriales archaeon QS_4_69_225]|nr:MAG: hypothetical protein BRC88_13995 [Halobacteriales archaeon QS_4_69_225]
MFQDITVLHVDDDPAIRDLTAEFLETVDDSISVRSEADPSTVPTRIDAEPVDCVVSDYRMPELDGLELCRAVRADHPWFPFVLFTSVRGEKVIEAAMDAGATDYIRKETGTHHYTLLANRITLAVSRRRAIGRLQEAGALPPEWPPRQLRSDTDD